MHRTATTLLDLVGLLLVAAGAYYLVEPAMGRAGLLVAGGVLLGGSQLAARAADVRPVKPAVWPGPLLAAWRRRRDGVAK